jgi:hypothetical protein
MTLILVLVVAIPVVVWLAWPRRARPIEAQAPEAGGPRGALGRVTNLAGRLAWPVRTGRDLTGQLSRGIDEAGLSKRLMLYKRLPEDAAEFSDWVANLSPADRSDLTQTLVEQCHALGFELAWLTDERIPRDLRRSLEDTVALCSLATWNARHTRPLAAYLAWDQAPERPENRAFAGALYTRLVQAGLITPPADMLLAPEKQRRAAVARAITDTASEHPTPFLAELQAVVDQPPQPDGVPARSREAT